MDPAVDEINIASSSYPDHSSSIANPTISLASPSSAGQQTCPSSFALTTTTTNNNNMNHRNIGNITPPQPQLIPGEVSSGSKPVTTIPPPPPNPNSLSSSTTSSQLTQPNHVIPHPHTGQHSTRNHQSQPSSTSSTPNLNSMGSCSITHSISTLNPLNRTNSSSTHPHWHPNNSPLPSSSSTSGPIASPNHVKSAHHNGPPLSSSSNYNSIPRGIGSRNGMSSFHGNNPKMTYNSGPYSTSQANHSHTPPHMATMNGPSLSVTGQGNYILPHGQHQHQEYLKSRGATNNINNNHQIPTVRRGGPFQPPMSSIEAYLNDHYVLLEQIVDHNKKLTKLMKCIYKQQKHQRKQSKKADGNDGHNPKANREVSIKRIKKSNSNNLAFDDLYSPNPFLNKAQQQNPYNMTNNFSPNSKGGVNNFGHGVTPPNVLPLPLTTSTTTGNSITVNHLKIPPPLIAPPEVGSFPSPSMTPHNQTDITVFREMASKDNFLPPKRPKYGKMTEPEREEIMYHFEKWFFEGYEISDLFKYPKKVFEAQVRNYEDVHGIRSGSINIKEFLKSINLFRYDKNNKKLYRGVEYRGLYLGFRLIEEDYKEARRNIKGPRAIKKKKEEKDVTNPLKTSLNVSITNDILDDGQGIGSSTSSNLSDTTAKLDKSENYSNKRKFSDLNDSNTSDDPTGLDNTMTTMVMGSRIQQNNNINKDDDDEVDMEEIEEEEEIEEQNKKGSDLSKNLNQAHNNSDTIDSPTIVLGNNGNPAIHSI